MADDPLLPESALGDPERITPPSPLSQDEAATPQTAVVPDLRPHITTLYVQGDLSDKITRYVNQFFEYNDLLAKGGLREFAGSWDHFTQIVRQFSSIDRLIILMHSTSDAVQMGNEWQFMSELLIELAKIGDLPVVKEVVEIEGCMIGRTPSYLIPFAKLFKAPRLDAFSYWHYIEQVTFHPQPDLPTSGTEYDEYVSTLSDGIWEFEVYLPEGAPSASVIAEQIAPTLAGSTGQTYYLMIEWFEEFYNPGHFPPFSTRLGPWDAPSPSSREHDYRARDSAAIANIATEQDAKTFETNFASSPVTSFYLIVVRPIY